MARGRHSFGRGLVLDRAVTRDADLTVGRVFAPTATTREAAAVQAIPWIRNQGSSPSCVGQALAACVDAMTDSRPACSAVSIWREARRRQGRIERIDEGTRLEYAIAGLARRGWDPYVQGEELDANEAGDQDDLADELFAASRTADVVSWQRIDLRDMALAALETAIASGYGVVIGVGIKRDFAEYFSRLQRQDQPDEVLGLSAFGRTDDGHALRVVGFEHVLGGHQYIIQNSWGHGGGCHLPGGKWQSGCCRMTAGALLSAWDVYAVRLQNGGAS